MSSELVRSIAKKIYEDINLSGIDTSEDSVISKLFINVIQDIYDQYIANIPNQQASLADEIDIDRLNSLCENNGISLFDNQSALS